VPSALGPPPLPTVAGPAQLARPPARRRLRHPVFGQLFGLSHLRERHRYRPTGTVDEDANPPLTDETKTEVDPNRKTVPPQDTSPLRRPMRDALRATARFYARTVSSAAVRNHRRR
jgi:hypothetical protein